MNEYNQKIAIAEACGKWPDGWPHSFMHQSDRLRHVPDYLNDLNAMHEAERLLDDDQWLEYMLNLQDVLQRNPDRGKWVVCQDNMHSTAAQRAEAFLKTLNLWEDDK
jgi:hypothetical protein